MPSNFFDVFHEDEHKLPLQKTSCINNKITDKPVICFFNDEIYDFADFAALGMNGIPG